MIRLTARIRPAPQCRGKLAVCLLVCTAATLSQVQAEPPITALAFTPDAAYLLSGSQHGVRIYRTSLDRETVESAHVQLKTTVGDVHDLSFSPDGRYLAIAGGTPGESGVCEIVSWPARQTLCRITGQDDVIYGVSWTRDARRLAAASLDTTVIVATFDLTENRPGTPSSPASQSAELRILEVQRLTRHSKGVMAVAMLGDAAHLVSAGVDSSLRVWSIETSGATPIRTLENHTAAVHDLALRPGPSEAIPIVASVGADHTVRFWQPTIGRMMRFVRLEQAVPLSAAWLHNGTQLAIACDDGHVRLLDPDTVEITMDVPVQSGWCYAIAVHPTSTRLAVGGPEGIDLVTLDDPIP